MICIHEQIISAYRHLHSSIFAHSHTQETSSQMPQTQMPCWSASQIKLQVSFAEYRLFYKALLTRAHLHIHTWCIMCTHEQITYTQRNIHSSATADSHTKDAFSRKATDAGTPCWHESNFYRALLQKRPVIVTNDMYTRTDHTCTKTCVLGHICGVAHERGIPSSGDETCIQLRIICIQEQIIHAQRHV